MTFFKIIFMLWNIDTMKNTTCIIFGLDNAILPEDTPSYGEGEIAYLCYTQNLPLLLMKCASLP
jgi:hypothetical protein